MQNVRSTNEYSDNRVLEDLRGIMKARDLWPIIHSLPNMFFRQHR